MTPQNISVTAREARPKQSILKTSRSGTEMLKTLLKIYKTLSPDRNGFFCISIGISEHNLVLTVINDGPMVSEEIRADDA